MGLKVWITVCHNSFSLIVVPLCSICVEILVSLWLLVAIFNLEWFVSGVLILNKTQIHWQVKGIM